MVSRQTDNFSDDRLRQLKTSNLYRTLRRVVVKGPIAIVDGKETIHLCSNDYLGLAHNSQVINASTRALKHVSQASSRLIAGNNPILEELEEMLSAHRKTEASLVYPTGYSANLGLTALADGKTTIFSDELNHASIIDACRLSCARVKIFRHNDASHLEKLMRITGRKIVITEGVFSMDGDMADLKRICEIAEDYGAITIVDDAHGDFLFGPNYSGLPANLGVNIDLHVSSLSKGLGCFGGYIAANKKIRDLLVNTSRAFIYTSALPEHLSAAAVAAIPIAKRGHLQNKLQNNIRFFVSHLQKQGFVLGSSSSQIIPLMIGNEKKALEFSQELWNRGVFAQAVRYPSVKKGLARLRITLTALHTKSHLESALDAFMSAGRKMGLI